MKKLPILEQQLKAIAYLKRLEVLRYLLKKKTASVEEIAKAIHLSEHSTSKHLTQLKNVQILTRTKRGRHVFYRLGLKQGPLMKSVMQILR